MHIKQIMINTATKFRRAHPFSSLAFQALMERSEFNSSSVFREARPYIGLQPCSKVDEMFRVCSAAQKLFRVSQSIHGREGITTPSEDGGDDDSFQVALKMAKSFEDANIKYAIGGALACGIWGIPRGTMNVNMNCFVLAQSDDAIRVLNLLEKSGFSFCDQTGTTITKVQSIEGMKSSFMCNGLVGDKRIDLFFSNGSSSDLTNIAKERRVAVEVGPRSIYFLDAESIAIFKLIQDTSQDVADLERLFSVQSATFDFEFVERILLQQFEQDDDSMKLFHELKLQFGHTHQLRNI